VPIEPRRVTPLALFVLLSGALLSMVDSSVVNVAIPDISRQLHASLTSVQWTVSGYLLALAASLPATAYLGRRYGTVRVYAISLAAFTATSVLCALAQNAPELIGARALQGVAAAPLVPLSMNLLFGHAGAGGKDFPVSAGLVLFLGPALGPTVGGLLVNAWGWPSIFLINAPIGVAALLGLPHLRRVGFADEIDRTARLDPVGLALLSIGLTGAIFGTSEAPQHGWWSTRAWPYWLGGLILILLYARWAAGRREPAVDLRLLRSGRSALTVVLCVLASVALFGVLFLLPILVQNIQGHGALASGLVLLPQGVVMGLSTKVGRDFTGTRLRWGIVAGFAAIVATSALLVLVSAATPLWLLALIMAGRGFGIGLVIQPLLTGLLAGLRPRELAHANTLFNVGQRLGGSIGVSLLATLFSLRVADHLEAVLGPRAAGFSAAGGSLADVPATLRPTVTLAALAGFRDTIWAAVLVAVIGLLGALLLPRPAEPDPAAADDIDRADPAPDNGGQTTRPAVATAFDVGGAGHP
jgi:EmrB/QacA subfamily drug resistance transporter